VQARELSRVHAAQKGSVTVCCGKVPSYCVLDQHQAPRCATGRLRTRRMRPSADPTKTFQHVLFEECGDYKEGNTSPCSSKSAVGQLERMRSELEAAKDPGARVRTLAEVIVAAIVAAVVDCARRVGFEDEVYEH
jgi:hypothetical protein